MYVALQSRSYCADAKISQTLVSIAYCLRVPPFLDHMQATPASSDTTPRHAANQMAQEDTGGLDWQKLDMHKSNKVTGHAGALPVLLMNIISALFSRLGDLGKGGTGQWGPIEEKPDSSRSVANRGLLPPFGWPTINWSISDPKNPNVRLSAKEWLNGIDLSGRKLWLPTHLPPL